MYQAGQCFFLVSLTAVFSFGQLTVVTGKAVPVPYRKLTLKEMSLTLCAEADSRLGIIKFYIVLHHRCIPSQVIWPLYKL